MLFQLVQTNVFLFTKSWSRDQQMQKAYSMVSLVCNKIETLQQLQPTLKRSGLKVGAASSVWASRKSQGQQDAFTAQFIFRTLK